MRWIAVLLLGAVMYFGVPYLWQRAMVHRVNEIAAEPPPIPVGNAVQPLDFNLTMNAINPPVQINTEEYEGVAIRAQADDAVRQAQAAQDQAWNATH
jgi:hypothetical protein